MGDGEKNSRARGPAPRRPGCVPRNKRPHVLKVTELRPIEGERLADAGDLRADGRGDRIAQRLGGRRVGVGERDVEHRRNPVLQIRACFVNKPAIKYSFIGYLFLRSGRLRDAFVVVNQQARFVLADGDWDGLKKLRPTGKAWSGRNDVAGQAG